MDIYEEDYMHDVLNLRFNIKGLCHEEGDKEGHDGQNIDNVHPVLDNYDNKQATVKANFTLSVSLSCLFLFSLGSFFEGEISVSEWASDKVTYWAVKLSFLVLS